MTDLERAKALLDSWGVKHTEEWPYPSSKEGNPNEKELFIFGDDNDGYTGFFAAIVFDEEGKFKSFGLWE